MSQDRNGRMIERFEFQKPTTNTQTILLRVCLEPGCGILSEKVRCPDCREERRIDQASKRPSRG